MNFNFIGKIKSETRELISLKEGKYRKIILYILTVALLIAYLVGYYILGMRKTDTYAFMNGVRAYFETGNPYVTGYIYLDYFCILFSFFLLPFGVNVFIRLITNMFVGLIFFQIQFRNKNNTNLVWWIYANYYTIYNDILQLNFNSSIPLLLYIYYTYRDDYPWTSALLLFCLFKVNTIPVLMVVFLMDILFKREWQKIKKNIIYLSPIVLIVGISLINSIRLGFLDATNSVGNPVGLTAEILAQPQHYFLYSFLIYVLIDKLIERRQNDTKQYKLQLNPEKVKQIWKVYFIYLLIIIITDAIVDLNYFLTAV